MLEVLGGIFLIGLIAVFAFTGVAATTLVIFAVIAIVIATIFALLLGTAVLVFKVASVRRCQHSLSSHR